MKRKMAITELLLPDYRRRHIFTTKLRLLAFVGFWSFFLFFFKDVLPQVKEVAAVVLISFVVTALAYYNIMSARMLLPSFAAELASDLLAITSVLYLTGGPYSPYFTVYLFYVFAAGAIYNEYLAAVTALASVAVYGAFMVLCEAGIIPPLILDYGENIPVASYTPFAHFMLASIFMFVVVYTVRVAIFFSQQRERELEKRNRELLSLHRVSSAVRNVAVLKDVIDSLLVGVMDGLNLQTVVLIHFDRSSGLARVYSPRRHKKINEIEKLLGGALGEISFPLDNLKGPALGDLMHQRMIFRKNLHELVGPSGALTEEQCRKIQELIGARRMVAMPLVVKGDVLGALVGFSKDAYLETTQVAALESFANHAAMSLQAAVMVDSLRKMNDELKRANEVKSEFLATMSHELRTPLTAIIGFSELLIEGVMGDLTLEQRESLEEVLHNAADLLDLINSLLDLTKIESGRMRLDLSEFSVASVVKRVVGTISPLMHKKEQKLSVSLPDDVGTVIGDEKKIQQSLLNLLANANKFTDRFGEIAIEVRGFDSLNDLRDLMGKSAGLNFAKESFSNGGVVISVRDNGIGIPKDQHERIFEMFHQADGSITRSFGGTGLGLALSRKFIELHGGLIWVESEQGKGARFVFVLPQNASNI